MKALPVFVYRCTMIGDCTNGGISSKYDKLLVLCDAGYVNVDMNNPPENLVKMVERNTMNGTHYHLEPVAAPKGIGWMAGGNYADSSDSRFCDMCNGMYGALAIHDRQETPEMYDLLSR